MPIRPENKSLYPKDWPEISRRIRFERAGNRCEWCGVGNGQLHLITGGKVTLTVAHLNHNPADCRDENLAALCNQCHNEYDGPYRAINRKVNKITKELAVLALPAGEPVKREPSAGWHSTVITLADIDAQGYFNQDAFDGPLMRRLTAEFGQDVWRVALRVTGVINRGFKTAKQLDVEHWTYDEVATRLQHMKAQPVKPAEIVQLSLGLGVAA